LGVIVLDDGEFEEAMKKLKRLKYSIIIVEVKEYNNKIPLLQPPIKDFKLNIPMIKYIYVMYMKIVYDCKYQD